MPPHPKISFYYDALGDDVNRDTLALLYRTSPTDSWHYIAGWGCHDDLDVTWNNDTVALPSPSATYQLAFKAVSTHGYGIFLDNFTILNIDPPVIQPTVVTNDATNVTSFSAELNGAITDPGNQTILNSGFEWKLSGPGSFMTVSATGNPMSHLLTGLNPNTSYSYRAFVSTANGSVYGELKSFTTMELSGDTCETPTNLHQASGPEDPGTIVVAWTDNAGASQWNLQYRRPTESWTHVVVTGAPTYTISNLEPATLYEVQVQAICENNMSEWSDIVEATSQADDTTGLANRLADAIRLYPNPANEYVDIHVDGNLIVTAMEVYDIFGKVVRTVPATGFPTRINIAGLANGMYFVRITTPEGLVTKKFTKK